MENIENLMNMMEKAKMLSALFGGGTEEQKEEKPEENNNNQPLDFAKIAQMMELINMFTNNEEKSEEKEKEKKANEDPLKSAQKKYPDFLDIPDTPVIESIKGALPYLDYPYQKYMAVGIKAMEMQSIIENYKFYAESMDGTDKEGWRKGVLYAIKPYMDEKKKYFIDILLKCMDMREILDKLDNI